MLIKNATKITLARGKVSIKSLVYDLCIFLLLFAVMVAVIIPAYSGVAEKIGELDIGTKIYDVIMNYNEISANDMTTVDALVSAVNRGIDIFVEEFVVHVYVIIFVSIIVMRLLFALKTVPMTDVVHAFMSTNSEYDFTSNFVHNIKLSFKYALTYSLLSLPFDAAVFFFLLYGISFVVSVVGIFTPTVILLIVCAILALKRALFMSWVPNLLMNGGKVYKAVLSSFKDCVKHFFGRWAYSMMYYVFAWAALVALALFSFGVAVIFAVPVLNLFSRTYDLVYYYDHNGLRYYSEVGEVSLPQTVEE